MAAVRTGGDIEALTRRIGLEMFERIEGARPSILRAEWWQEKMLRVCMQDEWLKVQAFRFIDVLPTMSSPREIARHLREYFVHPDYAISSRAGGSNGMGGLAGPSRRAARPADVDEANGAPAAPHHHPPGRAERRRMQAAALEELDGGRGQRSDWLLPLLARTMAFRRLDSLPARLLSDFAWFASTRMAHTFIAGSNVAQAAATIRRMRDQQLAFTIDVLGEAALSDRESRYYQDVYQNLIIELPRLVDSWPLAPLADLADGRPIPRVNVSVKLSALYSQFDPIDPEGSKRQAKAALRPLLRGAMERGVHLHIDMEHYAFKELTLAICREIFMEDEFRDYPHFGIVLQAYLKECERDAAELIAWARRRGVPIWVRLVKGAYWDTETVLHDQAHWPWPVWEQKWQSDACYERVTRMLLENHQHVYTAFGSHNIRSLAHAMAWQRTLDIPRARFELQMLYGMGDPIKRAAVDMGERVRVYTPYGELLPGMAYLIRRLLENTANESFLRHSGEAGASPAELLTDPVEVGRVTPPFERPPVIKLEFGEPIMDPFENVPNTDFTHADNRRAMQSAIDEWRRHKLGREYPLVIGGERIRTEKWIDSINPSRPKEVIGRIAQADAATADRAVKVAWDAFRRWRRVPPRERAEYLFAAGAAMKRRRTELAALQTLEAGKPWREADADVSEAIDFCNYYGKEMIRISENRRRRDVPGETNEYYYEPRGVVAVISPWNFPLAILTGMATAAVVTGNAVLIKPSEQTCVIGYGLIEAFEEAGLPPGVLNFVPGRGSIVGEALVHHPQVAMIAFTGSREVGCRINRVAAEVITAQPALKKVIAEMGGKNATIVDSDADLDEAIRGVLYSAFGYAGQKCSASSRCIVLEPVYDRFVDRLVEAARSMQVGPADDCGTFVPPVIDEKAWQSILGYIEIGKQEARTALAPDVSKLVSELGGYYIGPTIFVDVPPDARIAKEEIFGPVLSVLKARDIDHAIELFNGTDYALTGGIFSRSPANIEKARHECECGNFYINRRISGALVDLQPFGGFKMSGIGSKAGGPDYLLQFCEPRCVTENTLRRGFAPSEKVAEVLS